MLSTKDPIRGLQMFEAWGLASEQELKQLDKEAKVEVDAAVDEAILMCFSIGPRLLNALRVLGPFVFYLRLLLLLTPFCCLYIFACQYDKLTPTRFPSQIDSLCFPPGV